MAAPTHPSEQAHPEEHIREESLHKASTDLNDFDVFEGAAPDIYVVTTTALVRASNEEDAAAKAAGGYGINSEVTASEARPAKAADLKRDTSADEAAAKEKAKAAADAEKEAEKASA